MPEGDSIHNNAAALRPLLVGRALVAVRGRGGVEHTALAGRSVTSVEARGKHLLIALDDDTVIRVHLRMRGQWHRYRPGEPWRYPSGAATLVLETKTDVLVCFRAQDVEITRAVWLRSNAALTRLGPDLVAEDGADLEDVLRRARAGDGGRAIAEVLLDQRVAAGIGNVYKSEVLFIEGVDPWCPAARLFDERLFAIYGRARELLRSNLLGGPRTTTVNRAAGETLPPYSPRLFVYDRARRPCLRCGAAIRCRKQGADARVTYYCPVCQGTTDGPG